MNESEHTKPLRKKLSDMGFCYKTHQDGYTLKGLPDLIACIGGRFVGVEVKLLRGNSVAYTDHQLLQLCNIRKAGGLGVGAVCDPNRPKEERWALDMETTGKATTLRFGSLTDLAEIMRKALVES